MGSNSRLVPTFESARRPSAVDDGSAEFPGGMGLKDLVLHELIRSSNPADLARTWDVSLMIDLSKRQPLTQSGNYTQQDRESRPLILLRNVLKTALRKIPFGRKSIRRERAGTGVRGLRTGITRRRCSVTPGIDFRVESRAGFGSKLASRQPRERGFPSSRSGPAVRNERPRSRNAHHRERNGPRPHWMTGGVP